jgi:hypothetical protein
MIYENCNSKLFKISYILDQIYTKIIKSVGISSVSKSHTLNEYVNVKRYVSVNLMS